MADKAAERIRYQTEVLKLIVFLTLAVGGGGLSLVLGALSPLRLLLAAAGILGMLVLAGAGWRQHRYIQRLVEQLPEEP